MLTLAARMPGRHHGCDVLGCAHPHMTSSQGYATVIAILVLATLILVVRAVLKFRSKRAAGPRPRSRHIRSY